MGKNIGELLDDLLDKDLREYLSQPDVCPDCLLPDGFCRCEVNDD